MRLLGHEAGAFDLLLLLLEFFARCVWLFCAGCPFFSGPVPAAEMLRMKLRMKPCLGNKSNNLLVLTFRACV